ncbi:hypothetical protein Pcar_2300 [Syntrophotalea carbinolica DSM 2380]|uniref:Prolipoprotein diacylglyceryl transferase n=1 Tax=Syntrophotalea carbinolica (strain DSM 2380 / NBRC 103641 / GraBd1) TaxID=338963 RepID=Q3A268_SYNC1|nr:prolipoprotein diacylglyceryl transferase family protein [Syntrophotalea carbinolica]ABA89539.1 hypothetical protein Pcar_2300 [Syntrophotalea carbinolica DSM 2380]
MTNLSFLSMLALATGAVLFWGFRYLPGRHWQFAATVPRFDVVSGEWRGHNLTWYGLLTATACLASVMLVLSLLGGIGVSHQASLLLAVTLLIVCLAAAKGLAALIEGKAHTFSVGAAACVGFMLAPWIIATVNRLLPAGAGAPLPMLPTLAALATGYAFGEGLGRLACISFGCCYGKPLAQCRPWVQRLFSRWHFRFSGDTKKIAYADGLENQPVLPVQALTAMVYCGTGLLTSGLFLAGHFAAAFLVAALVTQGWRAWSETLRADWRGSGRLSVYQILSLLILPYAIGLAAWFRSAAPLPDIAAGLDSLWHPGVLLALQGLWLLVFICMGRSQVTGARMSFFVHHDRI